MGVVEVDVVAVEVMIRTGAEEAIVEVEVAETEMVAKEATVVTEMEVMVATVVTATVVAETEEVIVATIKIVVSKTANSDQATIVEDLVEAVEANTIVTVVI